MTTTKRGSILRLFFSLLTLHTCYCGLFDNRTLHFLVTIKAGDLGTAVIVAFGALGLMALADTFVNDFLPKEYTMLRLQKSRHLIFMAIAILNCAELFVAVRLVESWGLVLYCLLVSLFVVITAFSDIQTRFPGMKHARP
jgi:hypothetical protein